MATVAQKMTKSALFAHFADKFEVKRTEVREWFDELAALAEKQIKGTGEFTLPGVVKLTVRKSRPAQAAILRRARRSRSQRRRVSRRPW